MAKTRKQKQVVLDEYKTLVKNAQSMFIVKPMGVSANETINLKKELFDLDAQYHVVKNSLFKIALKEENHSELSELNQEEHAVVFTGEKISEAAKVLYEFSKESEKIEIQAGILGSDKISGDQVKNLATLPSKEILLGQLLSVFQGPIRGFVTVLNGNTRDFVQVLGAIAEAKA